MIRVFIADDQLLVRQGIRTLLELDPAIEIAGEAGDGDETMERVPEAHPDVLRQLSALNMLPPTLILTTFDDSTIVLEGIRAGARGFLLKDVSYDQLMSAIRAIASGETVFQPAVTERLLRRVEVHSLAPPERLTDRELEVVRLMSGGYSNKEIAHALGTAEGTIKNHVSSILAKFGVRDRTRAVLKALESGLL